MAFRFSKTYFILGLAGQLLGCEMALNAIPGKNAAPAVSLTSADITDSATINFKPKNCSGAAAFLVVESADKPLATDTGWVECKADDTSFNYTFSTTRPEIKTVYVWSKNENETVSEAAKIFEVKFAPKVILGQTSESVSGHFRFGISTPADVQLINSKLYVANAGGAKIMVYDYPLTQRFPTPTTILGQHPNHHIGFGQARANRFADPEGIASDGTHFAVVESDNNRILLWNSTPTDESTQADIVLGQTQFTDRAQNGGKGPNPSDLNCANLDAPSHVFIYGTRLLVADTNNNRILIWNTWPTTNNQPADMILGQTSCGAESHLPVSASSLRAPRGIYVDSVTGRVAVADQSNHRILIWNSFPTVSGQAADRVLGQVGFASASINHGGLNANTLSSPRRVTSNGTNLVATDAGNHRALIWTSWPTVNKESANVVLGQANFTSVSANRGGEPTLSTLYFPTSVTYIGSDLWIADTSNSRVLRFAGTPSVNGEAASHTYFQNDGSRISFAVENNAQNFNRPHDVILQADGSMVFSEYGNNRLVGYNSIPSNGKSDADFVIGQPDFLSSQVNRGNLNTTASANSLFNPSYLLQAGGSVFVVDENNSRVLGFNTSLLIDGATPDLVLGQTNMTNRTVNAGTSPSAVGFSDPRQIASDGTKFALADGSNNRVLIWNSMPTTNGQPADVVVGQPDMTSTARNTGGLSASSLSDPRGVLIADGKLYVSDHANNRILIYDPIPTANGANATQVIGQNDFTSNEYRPAGLSELQTIRPYSLRFDNGHFVVPDAYTSSIRVWKGLPTQRNQEADYSIGINASPLNFADNPIPLDFDVLLQTYTAFSDGVRIWIPNYGGARIMAVPLPSITVKKTVTNERLSDFSIDSCVGRATVLFNEGAQPAATDPQWQDCSTQRWNFQYTLSSGMGLKNVKVWFKDSEGYVSSHPHRVKVLLTTSFETPLYLSSTASSTNTAAVQLNLRELFLSRMPPAKYFVSEVNQRPLITASGWQPAPLETITHTLTDFTDGIKTLYIWSADGAGNVSLTPNIFRFTVDLAPPAAPLVSLTGFYAGTRNSELRLSPSSCGDSPQIKFTTTATPPLAIDTDWVNCSRSTHAHSFTLDALTEGSHNVYAWAKDSAGNVSTSGNTISANFITQAIVGQSSSTAVAQAATGITNALSIDTNGTQFLVSDAMNGRVLLYNGDPTTTPPSVVLGKTDLTTVGRDYLNLTASRVGYPYSAKFIGSKIAVTDFDNSRILIWNSIPGAHGAPADVVLGQGNFSSTGSNVGGRTCASLDRPREIATDGTRLFVVDSGNDRVLIWNTIPTLNNTPADVVIGQTSCTGSGTGTSAAQLDTPVGVSVHAGQIFITDNVNNRVLIYNSIPTSHGAAADIAVGQPNLTTVSGATSSSKFRGPRSATVINNQLVVADGSNRVVIFNTIPTSSGAVANVVLGQANFTNSSSGFSNTRFNSPFGITGNATNLWITESVSYKIKRFTAPYTNGMASDSYLGGFDQINAVANSRSLTSTSAQELTRPSSLLQVGSKFLVSDSMSHRILIWNSIPSGSNPAPDVVVGHLDMTTTTANDPAVATAAGRLNTPTMMATDGTRLFVSDASNHRILVFNSVPTANGALADYVIGQPNLTTVSSGVTQNKLNSPHGIHIDGSQLFVADRGNNRVLIYNTIPTADNATADVVIGQANFTSNSSNQGGTLSAQTLSFPRGITTASGRLIISDTNNDRVVVFNSIPASNNASADMAIGQNSLTLNENSTTTNLELPYSVRYLNSKLLIADRQNGRYWIFNSVPTTSGALPDSVWGHDRENSSAHNRDSVSAQSAFLPEDMMYDGASFWFLDNNHRAVKVSSPLD